MRNIMLASPGENNEINLTFASNIPIIFRKRTYTHYSIQQEYGEVGKFASCSLGMDRGCPWWNDSSGSAQGSVGH